VHRPQFERICDSPVVNGRLVDVEAQECAFLSTRYGENIISLDVRWTREGH
jgi:hypothetical protein